MDHHERRGYAEAALEHSWSSALVSRLLEAELAPAEERPLVVAARGSAAPVHLVVRRFGSLKTGMQHNGIFDSQGLSSDMPLAVSARTYNESPV